MAETTLTIPKTPTLNKSEDYAFLRSEGLKYIERLSSKVWTDYNTHDPGVTILELLCYAITDLGYRTSFSIPDLLAPDPDDTTAAKSDIRNFFTAGQILPVNPTSENDIRKLLMDIPGVKNAWLSIAGSYEQNVYVDTLHGKLTLSASEANPGGGTDTVLPIHGLHNVLLEFEDENAPKYVYDQIKTDVHKALMQTRNLCEDYLSITEVQYDDIAVCSDIELQQDADVTKVEAKIYKILIDYFAPPVNFYTLEEIIDLNKDKGTNLTIDEIFEGPLLRHGFIDDEELEAATFRNQLHSSDIYNAIMDIPEVVAVKNLILLRYSGEVVMAQDPWKIDLPGEFHAARLTKEKSKFTFYKGILPYMAHPEDVERELNQLQQVGGKFRKRGHKTDLDIPEGDFRDLGNYFPVQYDFPLTYGIGEVGLSNNADPKRQAQAKQLKGYLLFFEQLLVNQLAQLANTKKLFSYDYSVDKKKLQVLGKTYYVDSLKNWIQSYPELHSFSHDLEEIYALTEDEATFRDRRNRFLDHLLARFNEDLTEYSLTLFHMMGKRDGQVYSIADKEALLHDYPLLSRDRGKGFNYKPEPASENGPYDNGIWDSANIAGMKLRVARLLGMEGDVVNSYIDQHIHVEKVKNGKTTWAVRMRDPSDDKINMLFAGGFTSEGEANDRLERILFSGAHVKCYKITSPVPGKEYGYRLVDFADDTIILAESSNFTTKNRRTMTMHRLQALFVENSLPDVIRRRPLATDLLNIYPKKSDAKEWWVEFTDPEHPANPSLLVSKTYDVHECAESALYYILHNGDNSSRYYIEKTPYEEKVGGKKPYIRHLTGYRYVLQDDCSTPTDVAWGPAYKTKRECESRLECLRQYFDQYCDVENFHLVEHLLLRPRTNRDVLLNACIHRSDGKEANDFAEDRNPKTTIAAGEMKNQFFIFETKTTDSGGKEISTFHFELYNSAGYDVNGNNTVLIGKPCEDINTCNSMLYATRTAGLNRDLALPKIEFNPEIYDPKTDFIRGSYLLRPKEREDLDHREYIILLYADDGTVLAESPKVYTSLNAMTVEIDSLFEVLAFQKNNDAAETACDCDENPYSFRISVVLPAWPTRFRSQYFRRHVEKIIRQETPAHIYPKICWIGLLEMRVFERTYKKWLQTLAGNDYPNPKTTREFIEALSNLHNVYPSAVLHSCDDVHGDEPQIVLDNTSLGSL